MSVFMRNGYISAGS